MDKLYQIKVFSHLSIEAYDYDKANERAETLRMLYGPENVSLIEANSDLVRLTPQKLRTWSTRDLRTLKQRIQEVLNLRHAEDGNE